MFETFDFSVLQDPSFKEDAVREEIVAPMLKRLGYAPSGRAKVLRSKNLEHPFVRIGTAKHRVSIVPDYTLWLDDKALLVLDAKHPNETLLHSHHLEQAYSYAIHPEVRVKHYALCNGKQLLMYDIDGFEPVLNVAAEEFDARWLEIERYLSPATLLRPERRNFQPDLGLALKKLGMADDMDFVFPGCRLDLVSKIAEDLYSANAACDLIEGQPHLANFDFSTEVLTALLSCLAKPLLEKVTSALSRAPFQVGLDLMIEVDWRTRLGPVTAGTDEYFVPLLVTEVFAGRLNRTPVSGKSDIPAHVFSLRQAFDALQDPRA